MFTAVVNETVRFECSVLHAGGDWLPAITFRNSQQDLSNFEVFDCSENGDVSGELRVCIQYPVELMYPDQNYVTSCDVRFPPPPDDGDPAADKIAPDFSESFSFPAFDIHCTSF